MTYQKKGDPIQLPGGYVWGMQDPSYSLTTPLRLDEQEGDLEYEVYVSPHNEEGTSNDIV